MPPSMRLPERASFLESTIGIVAALSLMVDIAARANETTSNHRLVQWKANSKKLGLF